jgi:hypothetical protein
MYIRPLRKCEMCGEMRELYWVKRKKQNLRVWICEECKLKTGRKFRLKTEVK